MPNPDTNTNYHFYNDWGCGYSGEFVFNNPEFTQLKFKAVIEPYRRAGGGIDQPPDGAIRLAYELEARRPRRLRVGPSITQNNAPTGSSTRQASHGAR